MIVVIPFCQKEVAATIKNLNWYIELDGRVDFHAILSHDTETSASAVAEIKRLADRYFKSVEVFWYPAPLKKTWPAAPNWAWQNVVRYIAALKNEPWLWVEMDAIPIRKGWLADIAADYAKCGKPFAGHVVDGMGHLSGVAVYPPNVAEFSTNALMTEESAWDVVLGSDLALREGGVSAHCHAAHTLFQHCWCINPADGKAWNGSGDLSTFKNTHDVVRLVDLTMALFHRNKDGTLIDMLRKHYAHPELAFVPQHTETNENDHSAKVELSQAVQRGVGEEAGKLSSSVERAPALEFVNGGGTVGKTDSETRNRDGSVEQSGVNDEKETIKPCGAAKSNVEKGMLEKGASSDSGGGIATTVEAVQVPDEHGKHDQKPFTGTCEILIVTYGLPTRRVSGLTVSDFDWLRWCLRCIRKFCTGFAGVTIAIPNRDAERLAPLANEHAQAKTGIPLRIQMFNEFEEKGMLNHMIMLAGADQLVPRATTHVLHVDADYMFKEPITPDEYFDGDKPIYVVRSWESLRDSNGVVSDCAQWKAPTDKQLGFESKVYAMCRLPFGFPIAFYQQYRDHVESVQGKVFTKYMLSGKNSFPQDRMDFTAMGAYAFSKLNDRFQWLDVSGGNHLAPKDKIKGYWSHGGISPEIEQEIEGYLK